jgi:quercetin dioxygenase-like cupin family protein
MSEPKVLKFPSRPRPAVQVTLWEGRSRPNEEALRIRLSEEGYQAVKWSNEPAEGYPPHAHIYPEVLWVLSGNVTLILPVENRLLELEPGDRVEVPAGMSHGTMAGPDGVSYLLATK